MVEVLDNFGRAHNYLRISVTDRCNLRCVYCMPPEGIQLKNQKDLLTFEELVKLVNIFSELGIKKIRLTGGEPLVRKNLPYLIKLLKTIDGITNVGMTTNAVLLRKHLHELKESGLDGVNISLDTLNPDKFYRITLTKNFFEVMESIQLALQVDLHPVKLNVVVMQGINDDEILQFVEFVKDKKINLRFIEYMPFKSNGWTNAKFFPYEAIRSRIESIYNLIPIDLNPLNISKEFRIEGFEGTIGFITSMSNHFCAGCNRLRLSADGWLKTCLFYPPEVNLKDYLSNNSTADKIKEVIKDALLRKRFSHPSVDEICNLKNRAMIEIGG